MDHTFCNKSSAMRILLVVLLAACGAAAAASADIATAPVTSATLTVRTNLMMIIDDSLSMNSDYMPDSVSNLSGSAALCFGYSGVNRIFFDPNAAYPLPVDSTGLPLATPTWPNVKSDGYASSSSNVNLNSAPVWRNANGSSTSSSSNTFYYVTAGSTGTSATCPDGKSYKLTAVTSLPSALQTKYMIWYTYYRTRILMLRGSVGLVMADIDATRFRVGLSAISNTGLTDGSLFLNVRDLDMTTPVNQKSKFYSTLYAITPSSYTPLRPALEKIGKYFAHRTLTGAAVTNGSDTTGPLDPVQYSCQRNYAIMTTDGYWNTGTENTYRNNYTPTQLDGSTQIGNQDGSANSTPRPMLDDGRYQGNNWTTGGAGVANMLADIARYFYTTDLRTPALNNCTGAVANQDVCVNNLPPSGADTVNFQHMGLFTMGLGVAGTLTYIPNYDTATSGDFYAIKQGTKAWPNPANPASQSTTTISSSTTVLERADDLWHAAVNGGGRFFSATSPDEVSQSLRDALASLQAIAGAGSAAATSTLQPVAGNNSVYLGMYTTVAWTGNILALSVDPVTGAVSTTPAWQAAQTLATQVGASTDSRTIYFFDSGATNNLRSFTYANLNTAGKGGYFTNLCSKSPAPGQCSNLAGMGGSVLANANDGTNLVNFLRGQNGLENNPANAATSQLYRFRQAPANPPLQATPLPTPFGDLVNATPVYVGKPPFKYVDATNPGYSTFVSNNASRTPVVYAAANDGMLHAFNASTGAELWAYVPTAVMPNMWQLADFDYAHRYYVDGGPVVGDVYYGGQWHTVLVGGLGAGGRAYYALDVTDPAAPKALWEFSNSTNANLGLTFGNPMIFKDKANNWLVAFSSGYNNSNGVDNTNGNGNGYLYVLNIADGTAARSPIPTYTSGTTPAGTSATPSNLGRISAWVDSETNNVATRVYGGDMLGYVWRFDFDNNYGVTGDEAFLLARALTSGGVAQPITTRPILTNITVGGTGFDLVTIATGRLLGASDVGDSTQQSVYVFKDTLATTGSGYGTLRNNAGMVAEPLQSAVVNNQNTITNTTLNNVNWASNLGWYVDFLTSGERVNVDAVQTGNLLGFATNIPTSSVCTPGGSSWEYFFDITKGFVAGAVYGDAMTAGLNLVKVSTGLKLIRWNIRGQADVQSPGTGIGLAPSDTRRISWRELIQ